MENVQILIVEDDTAVADAVVQRMTFEGIESRLATTGKAALEMFSEKEPDIVLLDVTLPDTDGFHVIRTLRSKSSVPIIVLTAMVDAETELRAFEVGVDDYLCKPLRPSILMAHLKVWLKRYANIKQVAEQANDGIINAGDIVIDQGQHLIRINDDKVVANLTPTEFSLLVTFAVMPHKVITRRELLKRVWGWENVYATRTVDTHVKSLRQKIGAKYITTIHGIGYKFIPEGADKPI
jgi:DNA-binding response OmpR family regulator